MNEEKYIETIGELVDALNEQIEKHGRDKKYALMGCYGAEGLVEYEMWIDNEEEDEKLIIFTDLCSG